MRNATRWIALGVGTLVVALGVVLALRVGADSEPTGGRLRGKPVPAFELPTLDGGTVSSAGLMGRTYVVNFWNTWCIPCEQEYPALVELYERYRDEPDFAFVAIVRSDTEGAVRRYVDDREIPWTVALDPKKRASLDFGTTGQPETYVVAPDGLVVGVHLGAASIETLEQMVAAARGAG